jgi:serine/threonine protein kinase/WD40 repeat protein
MALTIGMMLGPYEITGALGAGGMGEVYRARDKKLGRDVALKVLPEAFAADPQRMARFEREAKVLASFNHPNIASIYGLEDSVNGRALVMELVAGPTLAERLKSGAIPVDEALPIAKQICDALECAHESGIIHRDLKPANVKVSSEGAVKLLDFGLAKAIEGDSANSDSLNSPTVSGRATQAGLVLGTAGYMSPEQAKGKPTDPRTDIWAFGVLLFEMLAGQPLYHGDTTSEILAQVIEREPDLLRLPPSTPAPIRELIRRCLVKNPRQRWRDIGDARIVIVEYLANPSATQSVEGAAMHPARSRVLLWLFGGLALGALVAGIVVWKLKPGATPQSTMRFSAVTNFTGVDAMPAFSPDGRSVAFLSNRGGQFDIWMGLVTGGSPVRITNDPNLKARPHWSPDGSKISYSRLNESGLWDVWTVPALGGTPRKLLTNASEAAWSPDGRSLVYANSSTRTIWISDAMGSNTRALTQPESQTSHIEPAFSHDGQIIAFVRRGAGPRGELATVDLSSGKVERLTDDGVSARSPVWSVDNRFVYFASTRGGTMNLWKIAAHGGPPVQITAGRGDDSELDLSADGQKIVFASHRSIINLLEVAIDSPTESGRKWLTTDAARSTFSPAYSPDGRRIAYFTNRKGAENESIWMMDADGSNPVKLVEDGNLNYFPHWGPDGQYLIFASGVRGAAARRNLRRLSLSGTVPEDLPVEPLETPWGDVGPDGRLVFCATNGQVQLFNPGDRKTQTLDWVRGSILSWATDGRHIASVILARQLGDPEAGVWVYDLSGGARRQVFRGWVCYYKWTGADELYVLEGKPDLTAILWRVRLDGSPPVPMRTSLRLRYSPQDIGAFLATSYARFDIHPDHSRIVIEAFRFQEADISMIENIQ